MAAIRTIITRARLLFNKGDVQVAEQGIGNVKKRMSAAAQEAKRYRRNMAQLTTAVKAFGAAVVANKIGKALIGGFADEADKAAKFSDATGIAVDSYLALGHAANLSGVQQAELDKSLQQLSKRALEVTQGNKTYARSFSQLGIKVTDASGKLKDPLALFLEMSDKFKAMRPGIKKTGLAMQLFGRTGSKLNVMFANGSAGIRAQMEEFKRLGGGYTRAQAAQAELYNDQKARLIVALKGVRNQIAVKLLPSINAFTERLLSWAKGSGNVANALNKMEAAAKLLAPALAAVVLHMKRGLFIQFGQAVVSAARSLMLMGRAAIFAKLKLGLLFVAFALIWDLVKLAQGQDSILGRLFASDPEALANLKAMGQDLMAVGAEIAKELAPAGAAILKEVGGALKEIWKAVKPLIPVLLKGLVGIIKLAALLIRKVLAPLLGALIRLLAWAIKGIASLLVPVFRAIADALMDIKATWADVWGWIKSTALWIADKLGSAFSGAAAVARAAWSGLLAVFNAIKAAINFIISKSEQVARVVKDLGWKGAAGTLGGGIGNLTGAVNRVNGGGNTTVNRSVNTGPVSVNVTAAPNWSGGEFQTRVGAAVREALQRTITDTYRGRGEVNG